MSFEDTDAYKELLRQRDLAVAEVVRLTAAKAELWSQLRTVLWERDRYAEALGEAGAREAKERGILNGITAVEDVK